MHPAMVMHSNTRIHILPFFANMVPEGANRRMICRSHRIDEDDFFGLLTVMAGKDCIGAVNLRLTEELL